MRDPRVIVCQHGARHRYAVPRLLEQAGMLEALYTDSCQYSPLGRIARVVGRFTVGRSRRLGNRRIEGIPRDKIYTSDRYAWQQMVKGRCSSMMERFRAMNESLVPALCRWGLRGADIFYSMHGEDLQYLRQIQGQIKIVVDVCVNPLAHRTLLDEYAQNAYLAGNLDELRSYADMREEHFIATAGLADLLFCPSRSVADGVRRLCPQDANKIKICPYGSSIDYGGHVNRPARGRILWAGGEWVRKGLHHLACAADRLKQQYPHMDFRVAGIIDSEIINMPRLGRLHFLGKLTAPEMRREFLTADMFVLPTLAEGMASVVIEALAAGCPVITTPCAGVDGLVSGRNGILVDLAVQDNLYSAILDLYRNRDKRDFIADQSQLLAANFTHAAWGSRLTAAIRNG